jgi:hypothetical protein
VDVLQLESQLEVQQVSDRMKKSRFVIYSLLAVVLVWLSRARHTYSATCLSCLRQSSSVERSILGITYSRDEKQHPHAGTFYDPVSDRRAIAPLDPKLYQEITGHLCEHTFVRSRFLRGHQFRKELIENLYRAYLRIPDQALARETLAMIDRFYPISLVKDPASLGIRSPIQYGLEAESLPNESLSILHRGLVLVGTAAEWRQVLDAARSHDGSLKLLVDPTILVKKLETPDPAVRFQVIDQLAALNDPSAWTVIAGCLNDPHTRNHAANKIVCSGHLEFFEAVFKAIEATRIREHVKEVDPVGYTPDIFDFLLVKYSAEEIRNLFAQHSPYLDRLGFAAIRRRQRFEFLDELVTLLNERPSPAAVRAIESLIQGPTPFEAGMQFNDRPRLDPWARLVAHTNMNPVESLTNYTQLGKKSILSRQQIVKLGRQRNPAKWGELRDLYIDSIPQLGGEETTAAIAQAMAESNRVMTLDFLLSQLDLDFSRKEQTVAAIAGLGAIADPSSLAPLLAFSGKNISGGMSIYGHSNYKPFIDYALHRCRGIHRWRLVKGPEFDYRIEKTDNDG